MGIFARLTAAMFLASAASSASAASFTVFGGVSGNFRGTCITGGTTGPTAQTFSGSCSGDSIGRSEGQARADFGTIGIRSFVESFTEASVPTSWQSIASFSDTLLFTSSDPNATFVVVAANFFLEGILQGFGGQSQGLLQGRVDLGSNGFVFSINPSGSTPVSLGGLAIIDGNVSGTYGVPTDALLRTPLVAVRVNTPIGFSISLDGGGSVTGTGRTGLTDFYNSFAVPVGSDAFFLEAGVTVNSGTWLVNNRRIAPAAVAVPEPTTWAMLVFGFGCAGMALRRRQIAFA